LQVLHGKAFVVGEIRISAHEIGQRTRLGWSECLRIGGESWFEGNRAILIGVGAIQHLIGHSLGVRKAAAAIGLANLKQASAPTLLGLQHLGLANI
jgi:hypothetical protein